MNLQFGKILLLGKIFRKINFLSCVMAGVMAYVKICVMVCIVTLYSSLSFAGDLYSAVVSVADYSDQEKAKAFEDGFKQVLQNVSANPAIVNDKKIKKSFADIDQFVNKFSYQSNKQNSLPNNLAGDLNTRNHAPKNSANKSKNNTANTSNNEFNNNTTNTANNANIANTTQNNIQHNVQNNVQNKNGLLLAIQFDENKINSLIKSANIIMPRTDRSNIIAWVAISTNANNDDIKVLGDSNFLEYETLLKNKAKDNGVSLVLPLLDLEDNVQVSTLDLMNKDFANLSKNASKYNAKVILLGNVSKSNVSQSDISQSGVSQSDVSKSNVSKPNIPSAQGEWNFNWTLRIGDKNTSWISSNSSWDQELDNVMRKVVANMRTIAPQLPLPSTNDSNDTESNISIAENNSSSSRSSSRSSSVSDSFTNTKNSTLKIRVGGVGTLEQYTKVENYLNNLLGAERVELLELDSGNAIFNLKITSNKNNLLNTFKLDKFLVEANSGNDSSSLNIEADSNGLNISGESDKVVDVIDFKVES